MARTRRQLAARRQAAGFTQESLAYTIGVDRSTVARWEGSGSAPQPALRRTLARALGVTLDELAGLLKREVSASPAVSEAGPGLPPLADGSALADIATQLLDIETRYENTPSAALLADAGRCYAALQSSLHGSNSAGNRVRLHRLATKSASLLSQLVWDASGRRDVASSLSYIEAAADHAAEAGDHVAAAHTALRRTYVGLYSVGSRPDPASVLATAEEAQIRSGGVSAVLTGLAELHVAEALAQQGEYRRCEAALSQAEQSFGQITADDPALSSFSPSQFGRLAGSCYLFLGAPERAMPFLEASASGLQDRPKTRSLVLGNLALGQLRQRHIDGACHYLHEAVGLLEVSRGGGGMSVVFAAARELYPWRQEQQVQDVHDRLLSLVART